MITRDAEDVLHNLILALDGPHETARAHNAKDLDHGDGDGDGSNDDDVVLQQIVQFIEATLSIDVCCLEILATVCRIRLTAGVGHSVIAQILIPVGVVMCSATFQILLHAVKQLFGCHLICVILHQVLHVVANGTLNVIPKYVTSDACTQLSQQKQHYNDGKGADHAVVFSQSTTAAKETSEEDEDADDKEKDWDGTTHAPCEVNVVIVRGEHQGSTDDNRYATDKEDKVEEEHQIFDDFSSSLSRHFECL